MCPGMMPTLHLPGEIIPGQFGPIRRERRSCRNSQARTMSSVGMPSVMQTIRSISASAASMIASAANGGGTKMTLVFAPVLSTASCTVLKIGQPSCVVPPFPGVTPPTTWVPYSAHALAWNVPSLPVKPCTINRVFLSTRMAMKTLLGNRYRFVESMCARRGNYLFRSIFHGFRHHEIESRLPQDLAPCLYVRPFQPQHNGQ